MEDRVQPQTGGPVAGAMQYYDRKNQEHVDMMRPYTDAFTTRRAKHSATNYFFSPDRQEYRQQFTHAHFLAAQADSAVCSGINL